jgi:hypothetical protein
MIKRFTLAMALSAAVLVLLPASAFAAYHAESTVNSRTWQYSNGAANITCWVRVNFDASDSHSGVYRLTSYSMRQTKNAGSVYVIGKIRGVVCGHDYDTSDGSHGTATYVHWWPGAGDQWVTVPMQRSMTSGFTYSFTQGTGTWGTPMAAWHYIDLCNWMGEPERIRLEAKFEVYANSDGRRLATIPLNVSANAQ